MALTNLHGIDLSLAVWLIHDDYDFVPEQKSVSITTLLKPIKQILLGRRVTPEMEGDTDISDFIPRRRGHAIHDSIEIAWKTGYESALAAMNIPQKIIDRFRINPTQEELKACPNAIPVYIEQRHSKTLNGWKISGKMDMCIDGRLKDTKTTSVYAYLLGSKDDDYIMQGSGYKWLAPEKVTEDEIDIQFLFMDWQRMMSLSDPKYPDIPTVSYPLTLHSPEFTEKVFAQKLRKLEELMDAPEESMPRCTDEELWRTSAKWKYYSNPAKTGGRATKNFDDAASANAHCAEKGKGIVKHIPGEVKACGYCHAFPVCKQKDEYFA